MRGNLAMTLAVDVSSIKLLAQAVADLEFGIRHQANSDT